MKALQEENRALRQQLLEAEAAALQQQVVVADLQHALAMAERRVATPVKTPAKPPCSPQVRPPTEGRPPAMLGLKRRLAFSSLCTVGSSLVVGCTEL